MTQKLAFVFPGQGSQSVGMLGDLAEAHGIVRDTFAEASEALGYDLWDVVQNGPEATLNRTDVRVGQAVRIVGEINNTGTAPGRIVVAPLVDGTAVGTEKTRWVGSKDTYSMPFTVVFDEPGTFEVSLRDRTHSRTVIAGNVTVEVLVVPTTTTTTTTATPTPTTTTTTAPPTTTTTTAPPVEEPAGFNPWWILVILLLALLGLGYREYRRRQQGV